MHLMFKTHIDSFSPEIQERLILLYQTIKEIVPQAEESIKYGIPTFVLNGNLVHFSGYKNHIGFYPAPSGLKAFADEISKYKNSKGAVQFAHNQELPVELIKKIVKFRVQENLEKAKAQK
jgi:uncharacterized protein YdhG (YjbR/CyaY superfamily)